MAIGSDDADDERVSFILVAAKLSVLPLRQRRFRHSRGR